MLCPFISVRLSPLIAYLFVSYISICTVHQNQKKKKQLTIQNICKILFIPHLRHRIFLNTFTNTIVQLFQLPICKLEKNQSLWNLSNNNNNTRTKWFSLIINFLECGFLFVRLLVWLVCLHVKTVHMQNAKWKFTMFITLEAGSWLSWGFIFHTYSFFLVDCVLTMANGNGAVHSTHFHVHTYRVCILYEWIRAQVHIYYPLRSMAGREKELVFWKSAHTMRMFINAKYQ